MPAANLGGPCDGLSAIGNLNGYSTDHWGMRIANTEGSDGQMEMGSKGIIQEWEKCCRAISEIASKFSEDPQAGWNT